jgi:uncharacterized protein
MSAVLLWILAVVLVIAGLAGTLLPVLPGPALVFVGLVLAAWIDDFSRVGGGVLALLAALTALAWLLDFVAGLLGAQRVGASRLALLGAVAGTVIGLFMGLVGVLFMPLVGAAAGEYIARREQGRALQVGLATWVGMLIGLVAKVVIACVMVGIFAVAWWW